MEKESLHERMQRVLLLAPLYKLRNKTITGQDGQKYTCMEFGLLALLFFFENMLKGQKNSGVAGLARFLQEETRERLFDNGADYEKLAREIVLVFRPGTGRKNSEEFFNWERMAEDQAEYSYLKASRADMESNEQYYTLAEQGLELIFATKEYFNEFQLSINQLILRKQLEKGMFAMALRQIEEMRLDVDTIRGRIRDVRSEIHRNIMSEETLERYRKIVADMNLRLSGEAKEFDELRKFVQETKERLRGNLSNNKEYQAYENILQVERNLGAVHQSHRQLLNMGIDLETSALRAAGEAMYYTGLKSFNFQQELTARLMGRPLPISAAKRLVEPLLPQPVHKHWSPLAVFFPQRLARYEGDRLVNGGDDVDSFVDEYVPDDATKELYGQIAGQLAEFMGEQQEADLAAFCQYLQSTAREYLLQEKQFFVFWMLLHRREVLMLDPEQLGEKNVFQALPAKAADIETIQVTELGNVLHFGQYAITNMKIEVKHRGI